MKILITGPESSGKSTLASALSSHFDLKLIPEYARTYLESKGTSYRYDEADLLLIAQRHHQRLVKAHENYIADTFLINIKIWSQIKYGRCHPWIEKHIGSVQFDKILLLKPNIPWTYDPLRESPESRKALFGLFQKELVKLRWTYYTIDAVTQEGRLRQAIASVSD